MSIKKLILITGPTATGKTEIALEVAQHLPKVEIISADSRQIYRYMDIGTAKPTAEQQNQCPHHLLDVLGPEENYSAGAYARAARSIIEQVWNRGGLPIMVGGTGLYWQSALDGCFEDVTEYAPTRAELRNRLHCEGLASLYEDLGRRDPVAHARLQPGDAQRILRALEVAIVGKGTLSKLWRERKGQPLVRQPQMISLTMARSQTLRAGRSASRADGRAGMDRGSPLLARNGIRSKRQRLGDFGLSRNVQCAGRALPLEGSR